MENCCGRGMCMRILPLPSKDTNKLSSRRQDPYRHRPRRLPSARRGHCSAHRRLAQPSTVLRILLPDHRLGQWYCNSEWRVIPWGLQEHRPWHPRRYSCEDEHLHRPWPNCLRRRCFQDSWQLQVYWPGCFGGPRWKASDRRKF